MKSRKPSNSDIAYFGGGCFWCTEAAFQQAKGVRMVTPGYAGGLTPNPTYEEVCSGTTGHAEVIKVEFNPKEISYLQLLDLFFSIHDPTTKNRQGADVGTQYRSIILYTNAHQQSLAAEYLAKLKTQINCVTELVPLNVFYVAESYHHNYFQSHPEAAYCQIVIKPKLYKFKQQHPSLLAESHGDEWKKIV